MKKLQTLQIRSLPLEAHFEFFTELNSSLTTAPPTIQVAIAGVWPELQLWLTKENALFEWIRKSELTALIAAADKRVDHALSGINSTVHTALLSLDATVAAAANRVYIMLKNYGRIADKSYDREAGSIRMLLEQFAGPYAADVAIIGLTVWITELQTAFNEFEALLAQREIQQEQKPDYTFLDVRKGIEPLYHQIVQIIDGGSAVGVSTDFDTFIDRLNPHIDRLNREFHHAKKDLGEGDHTVIEPIDTQVYTGEPVIVIPKVYRREEGKPTEKLVFAVDFTVTYKNNTKVGMAELIIHGKGKYKGQKATTFNIARV